MNTTLAMSIAPKNPIARYKTFDSLFAAFIGGKIAVQNSTGEIGLYKNHPDMRYWESVLRNVWNKSPENIVSFQQQQ